MKKAKMPHEAPAEKADIQEYIGLAAQRFRMDSLGKTQLNVAMSTGYTVSNISAFEHGLINNVFILSWYVYRGFDFCAVINEYYDNLRR